MNRFPDDFIFGAATASYQIEGAVNEDGRGKTIWDTFCETPGKVARGESAAVANDHYHRYQEDVDIMAGLGIQAYRFSFAWARMFPNGDSVREQRGFDFYNRLIDSLLAAGIQPFGTLYHWDLPQALQDQGGWRNRETVARFEDYAGAVAEAFGDRVQRFSPINEPWVMSWLGYGLGYHAPGEETIAGAIAASHHTVAAHNAAFRAIKAVRPDALVGPVLSQSHPDVDDITDPQQMRAAQMFDANQNTFWMDAFFRGEYPQLIWEMYGKDLEAVYRPEDLTPVAHDWVGINYYFNTRIGHTVAADHPNRLRVIDHFAGYASESASVGNVTDMGWPITPYGLEDLLVRWTRTYGDKLPQLFITENGAAYDDGISADGQVHDTRRIDYLNDHLLAVLNAMERGADIGGYMQWSLMDNFEWAVGFAKRFGIVHVDYTTQQRTVKDAARFYADVIKTRGANLTKVTREFA